MSDTATAAYYGQLVQANQQMIAQGVTSIQLTNLTWGPITIGTNTATANTAETWLATDADGTTTESTDTNLYTLVQQSGTWLIQSDEQPTSTSPSARRTSPAVSQPTPVPVPALGSSAAVSQSSTSPLSLRRSGSKKRPPRPGTGRDD